MPKRSFDNLSSEDSESWAKVQTPKTTGRSHQENQERAYIAASRRSDRTLQARVQSAISASEIHKRRTGKGFKITEEGVRREEIYEEEEDDFLKQYLTSFAPLQGASLFQSTSASTCSSGANQSYHAALALFTHQQTINRIFAQHFPDFAQLAIQQSQNLRDHYHTPQFPDYLFYGPQQTTDFLPDLTLFDEGSCCVDDGMPYHSFSSTSPACHTDVTPTSPKTPSSSSPTPGTASLGPVGSCWDDTGDCAVKRRRISINSVDPSLTMLSPSSADHASSEWEPLSSPPGCINW